MNCQNLKFKIYFCCIFFFSLFKSEGQNTSSNYKLDSILSRYNFRKITTNGVSFLVFQSQTSYAKPTILFVRGSDFSPLVVNGKMEAFPFDLKKFEGEYNFAIIPKPGIPIAEDSLHNKFINDTFMQGYYLNNDAKVPLAFIANNNLNYYVKVHSIVIDFLYKQKWVDKNKIYVVGHSQGTHVVADLALKNKKIKKIALLSCSPNNRFYESIRKIRFKEQNREFSSKEAQTEIDSIYKSYSNLFANSKNNTGYFDSNTYYSYYSFTYPYLKTTLFSIKQPTLIVYGTNSLQDLDCDCLNLELIEHHKKNIHIKPYLGMNHNFFKDEFDSNGKFLTQSYNWDKVIKDVIDWLK